MLMILALCQLVSSPLVTFANKIRSNKILAFLSLSEFNPFDSLMLFLFLRNGNNWKKGK